MNYYHYLKIKFPLYLISGVICAIAVFALITVHRYNNYLLDTRGDINSIGLNKQRIKVQMDNIDVFRAYLKDKFNLDNTSSNTDLLIYETLDSMHAGLHGSNIKVSKFTDAEEYKELPLEIETTVHNYRTIIDHMDYLESFRLPDFTVKQLSIVRSGPGQVLLIIKGALVMPVMGTDT